MGVGGSAGGDPDTMSVAHDGNARYILSTASTDSKSDTPNTIHSNKQDIAFGNYIMDRVKNDSPYVAKVRIARCGQGAPGGKQSSCLRSCRMASPDAAAT